MQWTAKNGDFVIMSHNNVPDFEANLLKTTLNDVEIEPILKKIDNEWLNSLAGNNAGADMRARGVWRQGQNAFFDNRLTNTNAGSQKHLSVNAVLEKHEKVKKRAYNSRLWMWKMELSPHWLFLWQVVKTLIFPYSTSILLKK